MDDLNRTPTVEVLYAARAAIGESPFYEEETGLLLWVDIHKKTVNFLDPISRSNRCVKVADAVSVSAVIPVEGSSKLLVLVGNRICFMDRESGAVTDCLGSVEDNYPNNRFNDAKCDSSGRLWAGTLSMAHPSVTDRGCGLYSFYNGKIKRHCDAILSNGIAWSPSEDVMYFIDTLKTLIFSWSYNKEDGSISSPKKLINYSQYPDLGYPDGMCSDVKGRLWVGCFGSHKVTCWNPQTKEKVMEVDIPGAKNITSCCFGGPNYEWLFVTSATMFLSVEDAKGYSDNGSIFVIKDLGTHGLPPHKFRADKGSHI